MWVQRKILGIGWVDRVTNIAIRQRTGLQPVSTLVRERRLRLRTHFSPIRGLRLKAGSASHHIQSPPRMEAPARPTRSTWLMAVEDDLKSANLGIHSAWKKAKHRDAYKCVVRHGHASGHAL